MSDRVLSLPGRYPILVRSAIYLVLLTMGLIFLVPLYVMVVNSVKPLSEITAGRMMNLPLDLTFEPWSQAWNSAQIGVQAVGLKPYFINSLSIVVPSVVISTILGAFNGYVLTKWKFRGHNLVFASMLLSCFIPFQIILIPAAMLLGALNLYGNISGLIVIHVAYGIGFTTLFFRNYYLSFPNELINAATIDGARFFRIFWYIILPSSWPIVVVTVIWQFTTIWNDFLFGVTFASSQEFPVTVALNNLVSSSTGVKEYNVHFAGAVLAALPTLVVYVISGKYFVRGLMAGAVKG